MADSYTIKNAQQKFSALVKVAEEHPVTITKQGKAVAVLQQPHLRVAIPQGRRVLPQTGGGQITKWGHFKD